MVRKFLLIILLAIVAFMVFIFWDNNRITKEKQDIMIDDLPEQVEGFTILQIADLHEKMFGKKQRRLIKRINSIDYQVIVFTGDMMDGINSENYQAFYSLIEGIENKENMFYVQGNADPPSYQIEPAFKKSEFIQGMEDRGVTLLESLETVQMNGVDVHFINFELSIIKDPSIIGHVNGVVRTAHANNEQYINYHENLWEKDRDKLAGFTKSDVVVALNHYPVVDARMDYIKGDANTEISDSIDLILAGHYHGGQIRLPFIGAFFVPEPWYEPNSFFPPKDRVKGIWEYNGIKQYVSTGLGSSDAIAFLKFRLFNPPEINILKLKAK